MKLYFVRHGQSEANLLNEFSNRGYKNGLTALGREQAHQLADRLKPDSLSYIYSSPLMRAVQTAEILSNELDLEFETKDALREYDLRHFGRQVGRGKLETILGDSRCMAMAPAMKSAHRTGRKF